MIEKFTLTFTVLATILLLGGCATYGGWQPTVDPYGDKNPQMIQVDTQQCEQLAKQAGNTTSETLKGAGAGALIGAAGGAALGAIWGNPATGAAAGATIGGIGGATNQGMDADSQYKRAFINCMRNRGHNVVN